MKKRNLTLTETFNAALIDLVVGRELGRGMYRTTYACAIDKNLVIKYQRERCQFDNVTEWLVWQEYKNIPEIAKWLSPCVAISASGDLLLQTRTSFIRELPDKLPSFLCDFKPRNYGTLGRGKHRRFVCHDYGFLLNSKLNTRLRNVKWWDTESIYK